MRQLLATYLPRRTPAEAPATRRRLALDAFGQTDVGLRRAGNEDAYAVLPEHRLFMVADGLGGAAAGEVASRLAVESVQATFEEREETWPGGRGAPAWASGLPLMAAAVERANRHILAVAQGDLTLEGMGTTFAGLLVLEDRAYIAHVGDSRVYRLRRRRLDLLTEDHSLTNAYIRAGLLSPDHAAPASLRHVLERALGARANVVVDTRADAAMPGDLWLLCTDGLHAVVDHDEIEAILDADQPLATTAERLVARANERGGPDNITVVLVRAS